MTEEPRRLNLRRQKLGSEGLGTGQEDAKASTLEEYATVLPFELLGRKRCTAEIVLVGAEAQDPDNGAQITVKSVDFGSY